MHEPLPLPRLDPPPASLPSGARAVVARFRGRLDWVLTVADWEGLFAVGVEALGLPGRRQGVGGRAALMALPLEHKHTLVAWAFAQVRGGLGSAIAQRLCAVWDVERFALGELDAVLSQRQWSDLRRRLAPRLRAEYRRYKDAQRELFDEHLGLVRRIVGRTVHDSGQRSDCAQEGALALLQAIDRVDPSAAHPEAYFAAWITRRVRNHLLRELLPVHAPVNAVSAALAGGASPPAAGLLAARHAAADEQGEFALVAAPEDSPAVQVAAQDDFACVRRGCAELTAKQRAVVEARFGLSGGGSRTLAEVAADEGISEQQVSRRERRALGRLREMLCRHLAP